MEVVKMNQVPMNTSARACEPRLSRRAFLRLAAWTAGATTLAACVAAPAAAPTAGGEASTAAVTLTFWTPGGSSLFCPPMWESVMEAYKQTKPGVDFDEILCGSGEQNFHEVLLARIAAGNPPDSTIIWDSSPVPLGVRGSLEPLDDFMQTSQNSQEENWPEGVLASCQFGGDTFGLPMVAGSYGIWYNQSWFEEKGIPAERDDFPKTWDDLAALSAQFTQWNGDQLEKAGIIPAPPDLDSVEIHIWSALNGGQLFDAANRQYTIDSESNIAMMTYFLQWLDNEYHGDAAAVVNSANWNTFVSQGRPPAFQEGNLAMTVVGSWLMGDMYADVEPTFEKWNVASFPVGPGGDATTSGYWPSWAVIPKGSPHREAAFDWLDFVAIDGARTWFNTIGDLPVNKKAATDLVHQGLVERRGQEIAQDVTNFFIHELEIATPMWDSPVYDFAADQISRAIERIMNKVAAPAEALAEAQTASQNELDKLLSS
jgi:multiple sugar transport system substrate-binding protein